MFSSSHVQYKWGLTLVPVAMVNTKLFISGKRLWQLLFPEISGYLKKMDQNKAIQNFMVQKIILNFLSKMLQNETYIYVIKISISLLCFIKHNI